MPADVEQCSSAPFPDITTVLVASEAHASFWRQSTAPLQVAHRGYACCFPENTLDAISGAFDLGADAVEIDLQMTRDGILVLMHDPTVERTTNGRGRVEDLTYGQIRTLDACSWFGSDFAPCQVPSLDEALAAVHGRGDVLLDLKGDFQRCEIASVQEITRASGMAGHVGAISLRFEVLERFHRYAPDMPLAYSIWPLAPRDIPLPRIQQLGDVIVFLEKDYLLNNRWYLQQLRQQGLPVGGWTVHAPEEALPLLEVGVRWILSDVPLEFD